MYSTINTLITFLLLFVNSAILSACGIGGSGGGSRREAKLSRDYLGVWSSECEALSEPVQIYNKKYTHRHFRIDLISSGSEDYKNGFLYTTDPNCLNSSIEMVSLEHLEIPHFNGEKVVGNMTGKGVATLSISSHQSTTSDLDGKNRKEKYGYLNLIAKLQTDGSMGVLIESNQNVFAHQKPDPSVGKSFKLYRVIKGTMKNVVPQLAKTDFSQLIAQPICGPKEKFSVRMLISVESERPRGDHSAVWGKMMTAFSADGELVYYASRINANASPLDRREFITSERTKNWILFKDILYSPRYGHLKFASGKLNYISPDEYVAISDEFYNTDLSAKNLWCE